MLNTYLFFYNWLCLYLLVFACFYFVFASFVGIPMRSVNSAVGLKICVIAVVIKKHKPIINKKEEIW